MASAALVSLGYEGRTAEELIEHLTAERVSVLVDVRLTPVSRKPGLSKHRLAGALADAGIEYVHLPALGNPKENRSGFRARRPASLQRFNLILDGELAAQALAHVAELLDGGAVALLCFERDHATCHRHLVADALRRRNPSMTVVEV